MRYSTFSRVFVIALLIGLLSLALAPTAWGAAFESGSVPAEATTSAPWFSPVQWLDWLWTDWLSMDWLTELVVSLDEPTPDAGTPAADKQTGWVEPGG